MQFDALFIAPPIAPPRMRAAIAMPEPTIARIKAYSAAEAPDWSFSILMKFDMFIPSLGSEPGRGNARKPSRSVTQGSGGNAMNTNSTATQMQPLTHGTVELPPRPLGCP